MTFCGAGSERCRVGLASADAHRAVEAEHEDLAVPDLAGFGGRGDRVDGSVDLVGCHRDLDLDLRKEAHRIFRAAVDLGVALLTPVTLDLRHGHPVHADRGKSITDLVELERLDDGHDDFHGFQPPLRPHACESRLWAHWFCPAARRFAPSPGQARATNQAPCQFALKAASARKLKAFPTTSGGRCDGLSGAAQGPSRGD